MSLERVFQYTCHVAFARIQANFEQAAYKALVATGVSEPEQAVALKHLEQAQATQASFEALLLEAQQQSPEYRAQHLAPLPTKGQGSSQQGAKYVGAD